MREQLVRKVEIIPLEVIVRNVAAGSICKRLGLKEGEPLPRSIIEYCYKDDTLGDPLVAEEHITAFNWASPRELDDTSPHSTGPRPASWTTSFSSPSASTTFSPAFSRASASPDSCRLWDMKTGEKLDKDRFRRNMGGLVDAYTEVARRLGLINGNGSGGPHPKPKLVKG